MPFKDYTPVLGFEPDEVERFYLDTGRLTPEDIIKRRAGIDRMASAYGGTSAAPVAVETGTQPTAPTTTTEAPGLLDTMWKSVTNPWETKGEGMTQTALDTKTGFTAFGDFLKASQSPWAARAYSNDLAQGGSNEFRQAAYDADTWAKYSKMAQGERGAEIEGDLKARRDARGSGMFNTAIGELEEGVVDAAGSISSAAPLLAAFAGPGAALMATALPVTDVGFGEYSRGRGAGMDPTDAGIRAATQAGGEFALEALTKPAKTASFALNVLLNTGKEMLQEGATSVLQDTTDVLGAKLTSGTEQAGYEELAPDSVGEVAKNAYRSAKAAAFFGGPASIPSSIAEATEAKKSRAKIPQIDFQTGDADIDSAINASNDLAKKIEKGASFDLGSTDIQTEVQSLMDLGTRNWSTKDMPVTQQEFKTTPFATKKTNLLETKTGTPAQQNQSLFTDSTFSTQSLGKAWGLPQTKTTATKNAKELKSSLADKIALINQQQTSNKLPENYSSTASKMPARVLRGTSNPNPFQIGNTANTSEMRGGYGSYWTQQERQAKSYATGPDGKLHEADLPDEKLANNFINFEAPLAQQSPTVREAINSDSELKRISEFNTNQTGQQFYDSLTAEIQKQTGLPRGEAMKVASESLAESGIEGNFYTAPLGSRNGAKEVVVFNPEKSGMTLTSSTTVDQRKPADGGGWSPPMIRNQMKRQGVNTASKAVQFFKAFVNPERMPVVNKLIEIFSRSPHLDSLPVSFAGDSPQHTEAMKTFGQAAPRGYYDPATREIVLNDSNDSYETGASPEVVLHEVAHAVSHDVIQGIESGEIRDQKLLDAYDELEAIATKLRENIDSISRNEADKELIENATSNVHEMISYGFTNIPFQNMLADQGLWDKFKAVISELLSYFGISFSPQDANLLDAVVRAGTTILEEGAKRGNFTSGKSTPKPAKTLRGAPNLSVTKGQEAQTTAGTPGTLIGSIRQLFQASPEFGTVYPPEILTRIEEAAQDRAAELYETAAMRNQLEKLAQKYTDAELTEFFAGTKTPREPDLKEALTKWKNVRNQYSMDIINEMMKFKERLTEKDLAVLNKIADEILDPVGYFHRIYRADVKQGGLRDAWLYQLLKKPGQKEAQIWANARDYLINEELTIPDDFKTVPTAKVRSIFQHWYGESAGSMGRKAMIKELKLFRASEGYKKVEERAEGIMREILGLENVGSTMAQSYGGSRLDKTIVTARQNIPPEIRALKGEITEFVPKVSITLAKQATFLAQVRLLNGLRAHGLGTYLHELKQDGTQYTEQLRGSSFGPIEGMYTSANIRAVLESAMNITRDIETHWQNGPISLPKIGKAASKGWRGAIKWSKISQIVTSQGNAYHNAVGVPLNLIANGNYDLKTLKYIGKALSQFWGVTVLTSSSQVRPMIKELSKYGLLDSATIGELSTDQIQDFIYEVLKDGMSSPRKVWETIKKFARTAGNATQNFVGYTDVWGKVSNWLHEIDEMKGFYERQGYSVSDEEIKRMAAEKIKQTNYTWGRAVPLFKFLDKWGIQMFSVYMLSEVPRTLKNNLLWGARDMAIGQKYGDAKYALHGLKRVVGTLAATLGHSKALSFYAAFIAGVIGVPMKMLGDDDDNEEDKIIRAALGQNEKDKLLLPVKELADGTQIFYEVSRADPNDPLNGIMRGVSRVLSGDGDWGDVGTQLSGLLFPNSAIAAATGSRKPQMPKYSPEMYESITEALTDVGISTKSSDKFIATMETWFAPRPIQDQLKAQQDEKIDETLARMDRLGMRPVVYNPRDSLTQSAGRYVGVVAAGRGELTDVLAKTGKRSEEDLLRLFSKQVEKELDAFNDLQDKIAGAQVSGVTQQEIVARLVTERISRQELGVSVLPGKFYPKSFSKEFLQGAYVDAMLTAKTEEDRQRITDKFSTAKETLNRLWAMDVYARLRGEK